MCDCMGVCASDPTLDESSCSTWKQQDVGFCEDRTKLTKQDCTNNGKQWFTRSLKDIHENNATSIQAKYTGLQLEKGDSVETYSAACLANKNKVASTLNACNSDHLQPAKNNRDNICGKKTACTATNESIEDKGWTRCACPNGVVK